MKKEVNKVVSMHEADEIVEFFMSHGYDVKTYEGSLLDNFLIEVGESDFRFGRFKVRKFIIIHEEYVNEWVSRLVFTMTDDEEKYNWWLNKFEKLVEE